MRNPIDIFASRLEAARAGREASLQDFIEKNNPGGMEGWRREYAAMSPEERNQLVPLSTRMLRGAARGAVTAGAGLQEALGATGDTLSERTRNLVKTLAGIGKSKSKK